VSKGGISDEKKFWHRPALGANLPHVKELLRPAVYTLGKASVLPVHEFLEGQAYL
jgi:hypothetical protein